MTALERPSPSTPLSAHPTFHDLAFPSAKKRALSGAPRPAGRCASSEPSGSCGRNPRPGRLGEKEQSPLV